MPEKSDRATCNPDAVHGYFDRPDIFATLALKFLKRPVIPATFTGPRLRVDSQKCVRPYVRTYLITRDVP